MQTACTLQCACTSFPRPIAITTGRDDDVAPGGGDPMATVRVLVAAGAQAFVKDVGGNTPRDYCSDYHPHELRCATLRAYENRLITPQGCN